MCKSFLKVACAIGLSLWLVLGFNLNPVFAAINEDQPVIEWLKFAVPQADQARFIEKEIEIWNPIDRRSPAFIRKEIWSDPESADNLIVVVYWSSHKFRKVVPPEVVQAAEKEFDQAVGKTYPVLEKREFQAISLVN